MDKNGHGNDVSQFRAHFKPKLADKLNTWWARQKGAKLGAGTILQQYAQIERFPDLVEIGKNVIIKPHAQICACNRQSTIRIGEASTIGFYTFIYASELIIIGSNCLIAPFVYIVDSNHGIARAELIARQPNATAPIIIGNDVWIGAKSTILAGAEIADGTVIAANSVFRGKSNPYEIWAGSPARKIGERK